jgi:aminopeptidase N
VRVWAPPDDIEQGRFALSEAKKILYYYEQFFNVKFPLPKQGQYQLLQIYFPSELFHFSRDERKREK